MLKLTQIKSSASKTWVSLASFWGLRFIGYLNSGVCLTQKKFTKELIATAGISTTKAVATPLPINLKLSAEEGALYMKILVTIGAWLGS